MTRTLPTTLENRIMTCDVASYMKHYDMDPGHYELVPVRISQTENVTGEVMPDLSALYSGMAKWMKSHNIIAVTDVKLASTFIVVPSHSDGFRLDMYGTGIITKENYPAFEAGQKETATEKELKRRKEEEARQYDAIASRAALVRSEE